MEIYPCANSKGCNITKFENEKEPEHTLQCLVVKILQESPSISIEQLCTIVANRYKYYHNLPPFELLRKIKDMIEAEQSFKDYRIVVNEMDQCVLLTDEGEVLPMDFDIDQAVKLEIKAELEDDMLFSNDYGDTTSGILLLIETDDEQDLNPEIKLEYDTLDQTAESSYYEAILSAETQTKSIKEEETELTMEYEIGPSFKIETNYEDDMLFYTFEENSSSQVNNMLEIQEQVTEIHSRGNIFFYYYFLLAAFFGLG